MIYRGGSIKPGTKVWACAYSFDNNKTTMGLIQKPIYGMIKGYGWDWREDYNEEIAEPIYFVPFKKGSETEFAKSKEVRFLSRVYADTYGECIELYNTLVQERIDWFNKRIEETKCDLIKMEK